MTVIPLQREKEAISSVIWPAVRLTRRVATSATAGKKIIGQILAAKIKGQGAAGRISLRRDPDTRHPAMSGS